VVVVVGGWLLLFCMPVFKLHCKILCTTFKYIVFMLVLPVAGALGWTILF
jgi:hypothetical protein